MSMSIFEQAERLLKALKLDAYDEYNNDIAIKVIKKYTSLDKVLKELASDKYNRLRYHPDLILHALIEENESENISIAESLASKLYQLYVAVLNDATAAGIPIEDAIKSVNVIGSLGLTQKEAWAVKFAGGKEFILKISTFKDGKAVADILEEALAKAENHVKEMEQKLIDGKKTLLK